MTPTCPFKVVINESEPEPFTFATMKVSVRGEQQKLFVPTITKTLAIGSYSIEGLEDQIVIVHKTIERLFLLCGTERAAFEQELERLATIRSAHLVLPCALGEVFTSQVDSKINRKSVAASLVAWQARYRVAVWYADKWAEWQTFEILRRFFDDHQRRAAGEVVGVGAAAVRENEREHAAWRKDVRQKSRSGIERENLRAIGSLIDP